MKGLTISLSNEDVRSHRAATGTVIVVGGVVTLMLGLTWTLPVLSIPPQNPMVHHESIVMVAEIRRVPTETPPIKRHVVDESPLTVPVPPKVEPIEPQPKREALPEPTLEPAKPTVVPDVKPTPKVNLKQTPKPTPKPTPKQPKKPVQKKVRETPKPMPVIAPTQAPAVTATSMPPTKTETAAESKTLTQTVSELVAIVNAHKFYPRRARQIGAEGVVVLEVTIDATGQVTDIKVVDQHASALLNRAAQKAGNALMGHKTSMKRALSIRIPVRFALNDQ